MILTTLFTVACAALFFGGFCRLVRMDASTMLDARMAFWAATAAAAAGIFAVAVWGFTPQWPSVAIATSSAAVQAVSSRLWRDGVPAQHQSGAWREGRVWRVLTRVAIVIVGKAPP